MSDPMTQPSPEAVERADKFLHDYCKQNGILRGDEYDRLCEARMLASYASTLERQTREECAKIADEFADRVMNADGNIIAQQIRAAQPEQKKDGK